jgi:hypothetical protein
MISGWNVGGHDSHYPDYTPDPRLGTWNDLEDAVEACHALGVRVLFFANIQYVDCSTDWYRRELHRYRMMTAKGQTNALGWGMGSLGARMGYTCPPNSKCDPAFPEFRRIIVEQMVRLAEIGADGVHFDKVHGGDMDFNPALSLAPDRAEPTGIIECMEETLEACRKVRPDFCLSVESHWDRLLQYCDAWWLWFDMLDHVPVMKYTFPEFLPTFPVVQPWDYNNVNNAVRYGYQILVGPVRFSASMADDQSRPISRYIREVIRIREELEDTIFFGECLDTMEARVAPARLLRYGTFRNPETGQRACVLVNLGVEPVCTNVTFEEPCAQTARIYKPFEDVTDEALGTAITVPGERLAIVVES